MSCPSTVLHRSQVKSCSVVRTSASSQRHNLSLQQETGPSWRLPLWSFVMEIMTHIWNTYTTPSKHMHHAFKRANHTSMACIFTNYHTSIHMCSRGDNSWYPVYKRHWYIRGIKLLDSIETWLFSAIFQGYSITLRPQPTGIRLISRYNKHIFLIFC